MVTADLRRRAETSRKESRERIIRSSKRSSKITARLKNAPADADFQAQEATEGRTNPPAGESETILSGGRIQGRRSSSRRTPSLPSSNGEIHRLNSRKESLIGRLRVLLSSNWIFSRRLTWGIGRPWSGFVPGTGKESVEVESILKKYAQ